MKAASQNLEATKTRLISAASELFAEKGFHGTKVRDIAERAGVNVAAGNYHYGSKKDLYLEVLREQFHRIRRQIEETGTAFRPGELEKLSKARLRRLLHARLGIMLDMFVARTPNVHAQLMMREMTDPSEALPVIVREFITPLVEEMREIVRHLCPELTPPQVEHAAFSITAQIQFYRFLMPVILSMEGMRSYSKAFLAEILEHSYEFSLGGMERLAAGRRKAKA